MKTTSEINLIEAIENNSTLIEGTLSTGSDGVKYRYDKYVFNYNYSHNWIVKLFDKLAGTKSLLNIENYSIRYERPTFKGQMNGVFYMKKLIEF